jgi:hypothetical protein
MLPLTIVTWLDAIGSDGWASLKDIADTELSEHTTVGFLVEESHNAVKLTMSYDSVNEDNYGAWVVIPKVNIISQKEVYFSPTIEIMEARGVVG